MKNSPIIHKFLAVLSVFGLLAVGATVFATLQISSIAAAGARVSATSMQASVDMAVANRALQQARADIEWSLITLTNNEDAAATADLTSSEQLFDTMTSQAAVLDPARAADIQAAQQQGDTLLTSTCAKTVQIGTASTTLAANETGQAEFNANCSPGFPSLGDSMIALRKELTEDAANQLVQVRSQARRAVITTYAAVLIGFALAIMGAFFGIRSWVVTPLAELRAAMERLARGDLSVEVNAGRRDEVGQMAHTVLLFKEAALDKQRLELQSAQAEKLVQEEQERANTAREAAAAAQAVVVEGLADGLERLSAGDLLHRLTMKFPPEYEKLREDFNKAMETLQATMQSIAENIHGVRAGAQEVTHSADDLSRRTEQQAASLEQTAAALDEITATVRKTAHGASEARDVVSATKNDAERSGKVVNETVAAMGGIEESSKQISSIIGVIDEIAFQTNLLALNAGVEAARAGDAGRGFAVVATEVRALAQRSADAAKEIKHLISASGAQVQTGVKLVGETGSALSRIVEQVNRLSALVNDMAGSTQEQATGLAEVNTAVNQMDQVTQQNAAMVEEATAASHALSAEADELSRLIAQFSISRQGAALGHRPGAPVRAAAPVQKPAAARPPAAPAGKFVPVAASSSAEDWDEF